MPPATVASHPTPRQRLIASLVHKVQGRDTKPRWTETAERLLGVLDRLSPCLPRHREFLDSMNPKDLKRPHLFINESAQEKLGAFYLCCALRLRPREIEQAGDDNAALLQLTREVAEKEVEPLLAELREFVSDYDSAMHEALEATSVYREISDDLFWHHNFVSACPSLYADLQQQLPDDDHDVENQMLDNELARRVYSAWLEASGQPVKGEIRAALVEYGLLAGKPSYTSPHSSSSAGLKPMGIHFKGKEATID
ncbi:hypothetical protein FOZ62_004157 [Perkinsus olseni]|uniref:Uncharacterized protein n=1 Tax=Perkinsus olseni TaxID=32597 RepID=A0A7J6T3X1_PEROL|nr:hypothetical protein FOZ62_004157 [Perkinsus olseni]